MLLPSSQLLAPTATAAAATASIALPPEAGRRSRRVRQARVPQVTSSMNMHVACKRGRESKGASTAAAVVVETRKRDEDETFPFLSPPAVLCHSRSNTSCASPSPSAHSALARVTRVTLCLHSTSGRDETRKEGRKERKGVGEERRNKFNFKFRRVSRVAHVLLASSGLDRLPCLHTHVHVLGM